MASPCWSSSTTCPSYTIFANRPSCSTSVASSITGPQRAFMTTRKCALRILAAAAQVPQERQLLLEVKHLEVRYGRTYAVKDVSLAVGADELVTVLGANGAGKTSLLRALQGLIPASGGHIRFDGEDITRL